MKKDSVREYNGKCDNPIRKRAEKSLKQLSDGLCCPL
jgi:hypothetical protein